MIIDDIKTEFYQLLNGKQILIIINKDIDAICSCKIIQELFRYENVLYTLEFIDGIEDLKKVFDENRLEISYFLLLNCGGSIDLIEVLEPSEETIFFVLDSHRPLDLCNIYSEEQIRIILDPESESKIPKFEEIFQEDEEGEESNEEEEEEGESQSKRRKLNESDLEKRRVRRIWEENRRKVLFDYSQFTYYSKPTSVLLFNLSWKLSKDNLEILWLAIVSVTEQLIFSKVDNTQYILEINNLQSHLNRLKNRSNVTSNLNSIQINFEKELKLNLYRHWDLESSFKYSEFTACKLRLWSIRGREKFLELLAEMGIPLNQINQSFFSMDLEIRKDFYKSIEKAIEKYELDDIFYASFNLKYGFRNKFSPSDFVFLMASVLEFDGSSKTKGERFYAALELLSRNQEVIRTNLEKSKRLLELIFKAVQGALSRKQVISTGPFVYYVINEDSSDSYLTSPHVLNLLANFLIKAYVTLSRNRKKAESLPLVVSGPSDASDRGFCVVFGIPPVCENSPKNLFGKAFEQAAERIGCDSMCDYFDTSYFRLETKHRTRFFDALTALLS